MILNILRYPNPILKKKSEEIKEITPEIKQLGLDMIQTMVENKGLGLAAPQVGKLKRIIVVQTDKGPRIIINPEILEKTREKEIMEEGCLCLPGLYLDVKRSKGVEIKALDENGNEINIRTQRLPARILQHEIEHLDGILFLDKIGFWQRWKARKKIKETKNGFNK